MVRVRQARQEGVRQLSQQHDEARGSLNREAPVRVASSPDNAVDGSVLPDGPGPASKTGRCTRGTSVLTLLKSPASSNPVDLGWSAMRTNTYVLGTPGLVKVAGRGGHGECLRRSRGAVSYTHLRAHETRHDLVCR